jgi:carbon storage regulator
LLVLRRRAGEAILIGNEVEIEIIDISRTRVKLGVKAPRNVAVTRRETVALATENHSASELLASRGRGGVDDLVHLLRSLSRETPQTLPPPADM